jgi:hypothetical protein
MPVTFPLESVLVVTVRSTLLPWELIFVVLTFLVAEPSAAVSTVVFVTFPSAAFSTMVSLEDPSAFSVSVLFLVEPSGFSTLVTVLTLPFVAVDVVTFVCVPSAAIVVVVTEPSVLVVVVVTAVSAADAVVSVTGSLMTGMTMNAPPPETLFDVLTGMTSSSSVVCVCPASSANSFPQIVHFQYSFRPVSVVVASSAAVYVMV